MGLSASIEPEAFGRIAVEAQAMGRPVIATDHGAARETVLPGATGWLVPPGDVGALSTALNEALALDTEAREEMADRAIQHVRTKYTRTLMCARTINLYNQLLAETGTDSAA